MNITTEAAAFRIWQLCQKKEWALTISETAQALDLPLGTVRNVVRAKRWNSRFRPARYEGFLASQQNEARAVLGLHHV